MRRDPLGPFRDEVRAKLEETIHALGYDPVVVPPRLPDAPEGKGDFAFPCFQLAKTARKAPHDVAKAIVDSVPPSGLIDVRAEGPYVNFTMDDAEVAKATLSAVRHLGPQYGALDRKHVKVIVEHTSANPNGPFHVGRARNPIIGDTVCRILRAAGFDVKAEYYVNDMGRQVGILAWGIANLRPDEVERAERAKADHALVGYYQKANELGESTERVRKEIDRLLRDYELGEKETAALVKGVVEKVLAGMVESLGRLNVHMDEFVWESTFVRNGAVTRIVEALQKAPHAAEEEGAWYLDLSDFGIAGRETKWFLTRRDGTTLYTTRDLAYHLDKFRRAERAVNVLGEDHKLAMRQLEIALSLLGEGRKPEVMFYSFVSLPEGKMSTRRGLVVYLDDLVDEAIVRAEREVRKRREGQLAEEQIFRIAEAVGVGALRFNIVSVQAEKGITFRWEDALNFEGASAPFVQYAHARCASIMAKAAEEGHALPHHDPDAKLLTHPSEKRLIRALARLPGVVEDCGREVKVHPVAAYAVDIATRLNEFYRDCPVLLAEKGRLEARLSLVAATKTVLARTLDLLGIAAPDTM